MTLNDNPLVTAEKRFKLLMGRRDKLLAYKGQRIAIEYDASGMACRMLINPYIKTDKAGKLIRKINKELGELETFLRKFK